MSGDDWTVQDEFLHCLAVSLRCEAQGRHLGASGYRGLANYWLKRIGRDLSRTHRYEVTVAGGGVDHAYTESAARTRALQPDGLGEIRVRRASGWLEKPYSAERRSTPRSEEQAA